MPTRIDIPQGIIQHIAVPIQLLRVGWPATALCPRTCRHRIIRCDGQRPHTGNHAVCRNEPPEGWVVITGIIEQKAGIIQVLASEIALGLGDATAAGRAYLTDDRDIIG